MSRVFFENCSCVEFNARLALSSSEDIEQLFKFKVKEDLVLLVIRLVLVPLRHVILVVTKVKILFYSLKLVRISKLLKEIV